MPSLTSQFLEMGLNRATSCFWSQETTWNKLLLVPTATVLNMTAAVLQQHLSLDMTPMELQQHLLSVMNMVLLILVMHHHKQIMSHQHQHMMNPLLTSH